MVGYDDSPLIAFTDPPLTTVRQPVAAMGNAAVRALVDEINGHAAPRSEYIFPAELVVRGSTAAAPARRLAKPPTCPPPETIRKYASRLPAGPAAPGLSPRPPATQGRSAPLA